MIILIAGGSYIQYSYSKIMDRMDVLETEQLAHVDEDVQVKQDERIRTQMHVVGGVLSAYDRVRIGRRQNAVVPLKKGACGGCFHVIPLQQVAEIKQMKRLVDCEACGRILVPETGADA